MRIAQVLPKIDLIVTADLPTARQTNILSVTSLRSLELENEKTGKEVFWTVWCVCVVGRTDDY